MSSEVQASTAGSPGIADLLPSLRRAAAVLRQMPDRSALAASLNEFMKLVPALQSGWVELARHGAEEPGLPAGRFSDDALTLPLRSGAAVVGVLRRRLGGAPLTSEHLHLLGAVADLLGAILELTSQVAAARQARALLALVIEHMPFGAACFTAQGELIAANAPARTYAIGGRTLASVLLPERNASGGAEREPVVHVARAADRLALVHVHRGGEVGGGSGIVALVHDLGEQARAFHDALARETYRALWLRQPLALAILSAPSDPGGLHRLADHVRQLLPVSAVMGPVEADAVAVAAPGTTMTSLRAFVRGATGLQDVTGLRVGLAELERTHRSPESFLAAAVESLAPLDRWRRPAVLLCDTSPSVTEALDLALRAECDSVRCHDRDLGWRLLGERAFDAIFAKLELDEWDRDLVFLRRALELQPGLRPFVVTDAPGLYSATVPDLPAGTPVFRKPFQVSAVRHAVREQLVQRPG